MCANCLTATVKIWYYIGERTDLMMNYTDKYELWLNRADEKTVCELKKMNDNEITECFYRDLEFGTGGLRGIMAPGTNRMNIYTVRRATQGLANEILLGGGDAAKKGVVIAFDSRNNSSEFAHEAANVLSANGINTYIFDSLRPTPELSFAVRHLGCARGIVITASHNPKEYNGYKVYGSDGGQIPPQTADKIIKYIEETDIFDGVKTTDKPEYKVIGREVDEAYISAVLKQSMNVKIPENMKIVYTPLHGSGNKLVREVLAKIGIKNVFVVPEQELPDGNFPTVKSPNPENMEAFDIAIEYAKKQNADLVFGTDPDSDRIGIAVRDNTGKYVTFNGNQTGALLCEFILKKMSENGGIPEGGTIIKTIVTTELARKIADEYGAELCDVLTGFKFIGEKIKEFEDGGNKKKYIFGFEESYGYLKGTYARDKDAVVAAMLICEMAAELSSNGMSVYDGLTALYEKYGYTEEKLKTVTLSGREGTEKISAIMDNLRKNPPSEIAGRRVTEIKDYISGIDGMPKSNVLKFFFENGWMAARPSGTEPKIKFYAGISGDKEDVKKCIAEFEKYTEKLADI